MLVETSADDTSVEILGEISDAISAELSPEISVEICAEIAVEILLGVIGAIRLLVLYPLSITLVILLIGDL